VTFKLVDLAERNRERNDGKFSGILHENRILRQPWRKSPHLERLRGMLAEMDRTHEELKREET
jgi:hypothetical protein